jgi:hypothetical protein
MAVREVSREIQAAIDDAGPKPRAISPGAAARPGPDAWSRKEILGHLIDSAATTTSASCAALTTQPRTIHPTTSCAGSRSSATRRRAGRTWSSHLTMHLADILEPE